MPNDINGPDIALWGWMRMTLLVPSQEYQFFRCSLFGKDGAKVPPSYENLIRLSYRHGTTTPLTGQIIFTVANSNSDYYGETLEVGLKPNVWVAWAVVLNYEPGVKSAVYIHSMDQEEGKTRKFQLTYGLQIPHLLTAYNGAWSESPLDIQKGIIGQCGRVYLSINQIVKIEKLWAMPYHMDTNIKNHYVLAQYYFDNYKSTKVPSVIGPAIAKLQGTARISERSGLVVESKDWVEIQGKLGPYDTWVSTLGVAFSISMLDPLPDEFLIYERGLRSANGYMAVSVIKQSTGNRHLKIVIKYNDLLGVLKVLSMVTGEPLNPNVSHVQVGITSMTEAKNMFLSFFNGEKKSIEYSRLYQGVDFAWLGDTVELNNKIFSPLNEFPAAPQGDRILGVGPNEENPDLLQAPGSSKDGEFKTQTQKRESKNGHIVMHQFTVLDSIGNVVYGSQGTVLTEDCKHHCLLLTDSIAMSRKCIICEAKTNNVLNYERGFKDCESYCPRGHKSVWNICMKCVDSEKCSEHDMPRLEMHEKSRYDLDFNLWPSKALASFYPT
jgi:hypothetical protein